MLCALALQFKKSRKAGSGPNSETWPQCIQGILRVEDTLNGGEGTLNGFVLPMHAHVMGEAFLKLERRSMKMALQILRQNYFPLEQFA